MKQRWTPEEIALIKSGFLEGKLVKVIALEVGRSTTAVNKFLSRSGIRTRRWSIRKNAHLEHLSSMNNRSSKGREDLVKQQNSMKGGETDDVYSGEVTTGFQEVVEYLKSNGYSISKKNKKMFAPSDDYAVNDKPISDVKLLILANRLRCEKHQPVFLVPELAWG